MRAASRRGLAGELDLEGADLRGDGRVGRLDFAADGLPLLDPRRDLRPGAPRLRPLTLVELGQPSGRDRPASASASAAASSARRIGVGLRGLGRSELIDQLDLVADDLVDVGPLQLDVEQVLAVELFQDVGSGRDERVDGRERGDGYG